METNSVHNVDVTVMLNETQNVLLPYNATHDMEPYSIVRRSINNPIFNPYFINYGYNKEELMNKLTLLSRIVVERV